MMGKDFRTSRGVFFFYFPLLRVAFPRKTINMRGDIGAFDKEKCFNSSFELLAGNSIKCVQYYYFSAASLVGSSITIICTSAIILVACIAELVLMSMNAYKCYVLAYGKGQPKEVCNQTHAILGHIINLPPFYHKDRT